MAYPTDPVYKLVKDPSTDTVYSVLHTDETSTQWNIPFAEDNSKYQKYLEWVADGNTAEPAS